MSHKTRDAIRYAAPFLFILAAAIFMFIGGPVGAMSNKDTTAKTTQQTQAATNHLIADNKSGTTAKGGNMQEKTAIFAAGCFWCAEKDFEKHEGVIKAVSGYAGGTKESPTYGNHPGYVEAVKVYYDPQKISYKDLLDVYWSDVDPLDAQGQFCDKGDSYKSVIFYDGDEEKKLAEQSKSAVSKMLKGAEVATSIRPQTTFYEAEDYHQDYYKKNPVRYKFYRWNCGRDQRLQELWGDKAAHKLDLFK